MTNWLGIITATIVGGLLACMILWTLAFPLGIMFIFWELVKFLNKKIKARPNNRIGYSKPVLGQRGEGPIEHYTTRAGPV